MQWIKFFDVLSVCGEIVKKYAGQLLYNILIPFAEEVIGCIYSIELQLLKKYK